MQVPCTKGSKLLRSLITNEPKIAVCRTHWGKGSSKCKTCNVVYKAECLDCITEEANGDRDAKDIWLYVGETSRSLHERASEHHESAMRIDKKSFVMKHWANSHPDYSRHPKRKFSVVKRHKSALNRLIHEAIRINETGNLNSKAEWRYNRKTRLVVEGIQWKENIQKNNVRKKGRKRSSLDRIS